MTQDTPNGRTGDGTGVNSHGAPAASSGQTGPSAWQGPDRAVLEYLRRQDGRAYGARLDCGHTKTFQRTQRGDRESAPCPACIGGPRRGPAPDLPRPLPPDPFAGRPGKGLRREDPLPDVHREILAAGRPDDVPEDGLTRTFEAAARDIHQALQRTLLRTRNVIRLQDRESLQLIAEAAERLLGTAEPISVSMEASAARAALEKALRSGGFLQGTQNDRGIGSRAAIEDPGDL